MRFLYTIFLLLLSLAIQAQTPTVLEPPAWTVDGINEVDNETVILRVFAPNKDYLYVVGDFNNWTQDESSLMNVSGDGNIYWIQLEDLNPGQEYRFQYHVYPDNIRVADVHAEKILDPWNDQWIPDSSYPGLIGFPFEHASDPVSVFQTGQTEYNWTDQNFQRPPQNELIVYELLIRDFVDGRTYDDVIDELPYLQNLGINAIELMPVSEFEGNESWGYNPSFYFAPDKYYGPKNELKRFINECHQRGIAVILDIAINHSFGLNPQVRMYFDGNANQPTAENPWFNQFPTHDFNVGYDYNHESPLTRDFCKRVLGYWLEEYHMDGFRLDLSKGFTQNVTIGDIGAWNSYDQSRVNILNDYANHCWWVSPGSYVILEHFANNDEETALSNAGMMLWGNLHEAYKQSQLGFMSDLSWASYQTRGHTYQNLITYMESHDEERLMFESLNYGNSFNGYDVKDLNTALARMELSYTFLMGIPGPKMTWQFGEMGYDESIELCPDGTYNSSCRVDNKPTHWEYLDVPERRKLYKVVRALNWLKREYDVFSTWNFNIDVWGHAKAIRLYGDNMNVVIIGNFDVATQSIIPGFPQTGTWYDYFTGASFSENDLNNAYQLAPGEYHIYTDVQLPVPDIDPNTPYITKEEGCTDPEALNYSATAEIDNNTCEYNITFRVDVSEESVSAQGIHIAGSFQGWDPAGTTMTENGDGTWSYTTNAVEGTVLQYRYINGNAWGAGESVPAGCGIPDGFGGYNRSWTVTTNEEIPLHCFSSCVECYQPQVLVTFRVNMIEESVAPEGVHIAGNFQGWSPGTTAMTDEGAGIWTYTTNFAEGESIEYKFINGIAWGQDESVPVECNQNNNRFHTVGAVDEVLDIVCFGSCSDCAAQSNPGCTDPTACNYDPVATEDDGSCNYDCLLGCTDPNACNYDGSATQDDGSCDYSCLGCTDSTACNYNPDATTNDGSCDYSCQGCTDPTACNYDNQATVDDGNCTYDCNAGCTDPNAENYDPVATTDNGSCLYLLTLLVDMSQETVPAEGVHVAGSFQGWDPSTTVMTDLGDGLWSYELSSIANESIQFKFINGNDWPQQEAVPIACGLDDGFGGVNRSLELLSAPVVYGPVCFSACIACEASGEIPGCTYPDALNYNSEATVEDGSCSFGPQFCGINTLWDPILQLCVGTESCLGDLNGDGLINSADLVAFLSVFGEECSE